MSEWVPRTVDGHFVTELQILSTREKVLEHGSRVDVIGRIGSREIDQSLGMGISRIPRVSSLPFQESQCP